MAWATALAAGGAGDVSVERLAVGSFSDGAPTLAVAAACPRVQEVAGLRPQIVVPGDVVTAEPGTLKGKGVIEREDGKLIATLCGVVEHVNKLLYIRPLKHRYSGNVGDVVVGRVVEVQTDRWAVEVGTSMHAHLHLGAIPLPDNVQRRRTDEDSHRMRDFFVEGDLISAEIQKVHESGELSLQARSARYGKLQNGVLAVVPSVFVRRQAQHIITLGQTGVMIVLGNNGWIWVCSPPKVAEGASGRQETINFSQMDVRYEQVGRDLRERICRARNSILALSGHGLEVTPESIRSVYEQSLRLRLAAKELLDGSRCASSGLIEAVLADAVAGEEGSGG